MLSHVNEVIQVENNGKYIRGNNRDDVRNGITNSEFLFSQAGAAASGRNPEEVVLRIRKRERPTGEYRHVLMGYRLRERGIMR